MTDPASVRMMAQDVRERAGRALGRLGTERFRDTSAELRELLELVMTLASAIEELAAPPDPPTQLRSV